MGTVTTELDSQRVERLLDRARRDVDDGLLPAVQIAVGLDGGDRPRRDLRCRPRRAGSSPSAATKAIVAGAVWRLIDDRLARRRSCRSASYLPESATNGKDAVTVEHRPPAHRRVPVSHRSDPVAGPPSRAGRSAYAKWRLNFEPGQTYMYHPTAGHWVLVST